MAELLLSDLCEHGYQVEESSDGLRLPFVEEVRIFSFSLLGTFF